MNREISFQVEDFCVVTPCSVVVGYQRFGELCCLHLQVKVNGIGKGSIDTGREYRRVYLPSSNRK
jgi:hypothetical protein